MSKFITFFALLVILILGGLYFVFVADIPVEPIIPVVVAPTGPVLLNRVNYMCNETKTIDAAFYRTPAETSSVVGQPPVPQGSATLILSDGRTLELPQTISADGARYANADEAFVFWSKGNGALVLENNEEAEYIGCVLVAPVVVGVNLPAIYANTEGTFSLRLPSLANANTSGYKVDETYSYDLTPVVGIDGVKFTIPTSLSKGTNLSDDSYISIESIDGGETCGARMFMADALGTTSVTEQGVMYSIATSSGAGAGNRYEETVYALPHINPCVAVRYFIHYGVFENYATGTVVAFDKAALITEFDQIRRTLIVK